MGTHDAVADVVLTDEDLRRIDDVFPRSAAAGDRYPDMSAANR